MQVEDERRHADQYKEQVRRGCLEPQLLKNLSFHCLLFKKRYLVSCLKHSIQTMRMARGHLIQKSGNGLIHMDLTQIRSENLEGEKMELSLFVILHGKVCMAITFFSLVLQKFAGKLMSNTWQSILSEARVLLVCFMKSKGAKLRHLNVFPSGMSGCYN